MRCRRVGWDPFGFLALLLFVVLYITLYQHFCDLVIVVLILIEDYWFIMYTRGAMEEY